MKFITFSFDDGVEDDVRLVHMMNKYGLKGTFNLNSGLMSRNLSWCYRGEKEVRHLNYFDYPNLYKGHEIACHSYSHPRLEELDKATLDNQIRLDKKILEYLYDCKIRGMAYPCGSYNEDVWETLRNNQVEYCRTIADTHEFSMPKEPLIWHPTCHFKYERIMELAEMFVNNNSQEEMLFYIWGHSYELITEEDWENFENLCQFLSGRKEICYCTNAEILDVIDVGKKKTPNK